MGRGPFPASSSPRELSIMKFVVATSAAVTTAVAFTVGTATAHRGPSGVAHPVSRLVASASAARHYRPAAPLMSATEADSLVQTYCTDCPNDAVLSGNLSLEHF